MPERTTRDPGGGAVEARSQTDLRRGPTAERSPAAPPHRPDLANRAAARPLPVEHVIALQHTRGNRFVQRLLVRREGHGPDAAAVEEHGPDVAPPVKPAKTMIDKAKSVEVLKKSFKGYKKIKAGKVVVLDQAGFEKAWEKIYGETKYAWDKYVKPGNLEGFAYKGTNYINKDIGSVDVVPHEMLHNNASKSWTPFAGSETNEGTTEYLTIKAVTAEGYTASHSYPNQEGVVQVLVGVVGEAKLMSAYFKGNTRALKKAMEGACKGSWAEFKKAMQSKQWAKAKALLEAK